jgi:hypothetical protein
MRGTPRHAEDGHVVSVNTYEGSYESEIGGRYKKKKPPDPAFYHVFSKFTGYVDDTCAHL